ncbi:MAG TPA: hypothetical protein VLK33_06295 [Terriglobales bacterium]|nr:hypothetical protein [Terriglobales bacterium]
MKVRVLLYCLLGGLPMLISAMGAGHPGWWFLSGVVMAAALFPLRSLARASRWHNSA